MQFRSNLRTNLIDEEICFFKPEAEKIILEEKIPYKDLKSLIDLYIQKFHDLDSLLTSLKKYNKKPLAEVMRAKQHIASAFIQDSAHLFTSVVLEHRITKKIDQLPLFRNLELRFLDKFAEIYEEQAESWNVLKFSKGEIEVFSKNINHILDEEIKITNDDTSLLKKNIVDSYIAHFQLIANMLNKMHSSADKKAFNMSLLRCEDNFEKNIIKVAKDDVVATLLFRKIENLNIALKKKAFRVLKEGGEMRELVRLFSVHQMGKMFDLTHVPPMEERNWFEEIIVNSGFFSASTERPAEKKSTLEITIGK